MNHYSEPGSYSRHKVKVVLDFSNYATRKESDHVRGVDTSDLAAKNVLLF